MGASSTESRARIAATRHRLDENLDELLKQLAPNDAVAAFLRRPVTLALVGAGVVLALVLPKTPPERMLKRKSRKKKSEPQPEPEPTTSEKAQRTASLLEELPPRLLKALADVGVVSIVAKRWLDRNVPRWLDERLSRSSSNGHVGLPSWLERHLPKQLSPNGHSKRRGVLRFLP